MSTIQNDTDLVRVYLKEIGRVPLLTPEQEVTYGKAVQTLMMLESVKAELTEAVGHELTLDEWSKAANMTVETLQAVVVAGQQAKRQMVEANLRLVVSVAKKYLKRDVEMLDLIQEGTIGLQRGVEKFDPSKGYRFSTYAYWWIRQAVTRAIAEKSRTMRLPIHIHEKINKIKKTQRQLAQQLGRSATVQEVASQLKLTPEQVRDCLSHIRRPLSLDLRLGDNQDMELGSLLEDDGPSPEDYAAQGLMHSDVTHMMNALTPQQQEVISLHFGLKDGQKMTFAQIGERLNVSRERARQIEREAFKYLRREYGNIRNHLATA
ncbi:rna polymerase sigma cyanobacterial -like family [Leptolyngbya sp. Heron Island J]|uniref:RNA polymerase sigma factor, RpoD/SigA family n=1 Tax=Leptolyngbya sp. Heron Island J TaxID=1385935 RepID=UPI0003B97F94|nr:RNA polymerase sigma factor, RpoD/SigA family [Leptolyngbya sp. Heron Island J]ESA32985.1 rna polymerase sigma cyanobacterial -like family [Leptolyngbya sp. Heron Island J]